MTDSTLAFPFLITIYDPVGNRLARTGTLLTSQAFSFDADDRLNTDTYDASGNTLFGAGFGQSQADEYDFENRLITRHTSSATVHITYDGDGNRVSKTLVTATNSINMFYTVDELNPSGYAQVLEEHTSVNSQPATINCIYTYGHTLISQDRWNGSQWMPSFYGFDGHNNVRYLTDANANVTDTYDYDAFGNLITQTGSTMNNYLFTGEQYDPDLGLYYLRARYQNTDTGRFWTQDSFEGNSGDPSSLHKYAYCGNRPVNARDPSGNSELTEFVVATTLDVAARASFASLMATFSGEMSMLDTEIASNFTATDKQLAQSFSMGYKMGFVFGLTASICPAVALAAGSAFGTGGVITAAADDNWSLLLFRAGSFGAGTFFAIAGAAGPTPFELERSFEMSYAAEDDFAAYDDLDLVVDDAGNVTVREAKIHGNSLDCPSLTQGYTLRDKTTGEILKYGQTIHGLRRFSQAYRDRNNAEMFFETEGSKREIRAWETEQIKSYMAQHGGKLPPLNRCTH